MRINNLQQFVEMVGKEQAFEMLLMLSYHFQEAPRYQCEASIGSYDAPQCQNVSDERFCPQHREA